MDKRYLDVGYGGVDGILVERDGGGSGDGGIN